MYLLYEGGTGLFSNRKTHVYFRHSSEIILGGKCQSDHHSSQLVSSPYLVILRQLPLELLPEIFYVEVNNVTISGTILHSDTVIGVGQLPVKSRITSEVLR